MGGLVCHSRCHHAVPCIRLLEFYSLLAHAGDYRKSQFVHTRSLSFVKTDHVSMRTGQVDRLWTFLPVIYSAHFTFYWHIQQHGLSNLVNHLKTFTCPEAVDPRMLLVFALQCLWSARLTRNAFYRGFFNVCTRGNNVYEKDD